MSIAKLKEYLKEQLKHGGVVAFSGGVDSTVILKIAADISKEYGYAVYAVTFETRLHPKADLENSQSIAKELEIPHHIVEIDELTNEKILQNPVDRCYHCKKQLFVELVNFAEKHNLGVVLDGTNYDDLSQYRPGIKALGELGVVSPLARLSIDKATVRAMASELGLKVSNRPSAPCLATRIPYNTKLDFTILEMIDKGENYLKNIGFPINRIRLHGDIARIELPKDIITQALELREDIIENLKKLGFVYITIDLEGFRSGSMDIYIKK